MLGCRFLLRLLLVRSHGIKTPEVKKKNYSQESEPQKCILIVYRPPLKAKQYSFLPMSVCLPVCTFSKIDF